MPFIDFNELKASVSYADVVTRLNLTVKQKGNQWRGPCPACKSGGDRALVITEGKGYFCFAAHQGGDQIALAAHVLALSVKDAAAHLVGQQSPTVPESEGGKETQKLQPLPYLEFDHPAVHAIGFDPEVAERLGIGYASKGIMRGTVAIPVRDANGTLLGYVGATELVLPKDFQSNVVKFPKTA